jgi:glucose-6-phosphate 1-dehydrogenase
MIKKHNHTPNQINRLVIEKPFGKDTEDCKKMMQSIAKDWEEEEVYRIDHYLGRSADHHPLQSAKPLIVL